MEVTSMEWNEIINVLKKYFTKFKTIYINLCVLKRFAIIVPNSTFGDCIQIGQDIS